MWTAHVKTSSRTSLEDMGCFVANGARLVVGVPIKFGPCEYGAGLISGRKAEDLGRTTVTVPPMRRKTPTNNVVCPGYVELGGTVRFTISGRGDVLRLPRVPFSLPSYSSLLGRGHASPPHVNNLGVPSYV